MLKLRREHLEAFSRSQMEDFFLRAVRHLRDYVAQPTAALSDDQLLERIRECLPRARECGLVTESQIMAFVDASYLVDRHFDTNPAQDWSRGILESANFDAEEKAMALLLIAREIYEGNQSRG